jgi:hypothetical protein
MKNRCNRPTLRNYKNYGGREITYDTRWELFVNFLKDMGEAPVGMSLDRKDNDGPYCKSNCRWSDRKTQARNRRTTKKYFIDGVWMCQKDYAEHLGFTESQFMDRMKRWGSLTKPE